MARPRHLQQTTLTTNDEAELLTRATSAMDSAGSRALSRLLQAHQAGTRAVIRTLVGHPKDLEDVLQEALLEAFTDLANKQPNVPFSAWLRGLAVQKSAAFLALQRRWRPGAQMFVQDYCATTETTPDVAATYGEEGFAYDVKEHIAFCLTAVGRSLPMEEQLAVVLVDVLGVSMEEAARVQRINFDSMQRFLLNGRTNLELLYGRMCGLVDEANPCDMCRGLRAVAPEEKRGEDPDSLGLNSGSGEDRLHRRLKIVSDADLDAGRMRALHDFLFELIAQNENNRETPKDTDEHLPTQRTRWEDLQTFNN